MRRVGWETRLGSAVALGLAGVAAVFVVLVCLPFPILESIADGVAADGDADFLTRASQVGARLVILAVAGIAGVAAALAWVLRKTVGATLAGPPTFLRALAEHARAGIRDTERRHLVVLGVILAAGAALRVFYALDLPVRNDEAHTFLHFAFQPLTQSLRDFSSFNNHFLNTLLVHVCSLVFGRELWALRLPSLVAGILVCPLAYVLTRRFFGKNAALIAVAFVATSSYLIEFSCVARGYSMMALAFLALFIIATYMAEWPNGQGVLVFAGVAALGFFANPTMLYPFGVVFWWLAATAVVVRQGKERRPALRDAVLAGALSVAAVVAVYAPALHYTGLEGIVAGSAMRKFVDPTSGYYETFATFTRSIADMWTRDVPFVLLIALAAGFVVALVLRRNVWRMTVPAQWPGIAWLGLLTVVQPAMPPGRAWFALLPLCLGLAAGGVTYALEALTTWRRFLSMPAATELVAMAVLVWAGGSIVTHRSVYDSTEDVWLADAEELVVHFKETLGPDDKVIVVCPSDKITYYYSGLHGVSMRHYQLTRETDWVYVVVNERVLDFDGTIRAYEEALYTGFGERLIRPPTLIERFSSTALYRIDLVPLSSP